MPFVFLEYYKKVTDYQKYGIKVTIAIGGWNDSEGDKYSRLVNNPSARKKFIEHVLKFIEKHNFDGLDLDWEYPSCWQVGFLIIGLDFLPIFIRPSARKSGIKTRLHLLLLFLS